MSKFAMMEKMSRASIAFVGGEIERLVEIDKGEGWMMKEKEKMDMRWVGLSSMGKVGWQ